MNEQSVKYLTVIASGTDGSQYAVGCPVGKSILPPLPNDERWSRDWIGGFGISIDGTTDKPTPPKSHRRKEDIR